MGRRHGWEVRVSWKLEGQWVEKQNVIIYLVKLTNNVFCIRVYN